MDFLSEKQTVLLDNHDSLNLPQTPAYRILTSLIPISDLLCTDSPTPQKCENGNKPEMTFELGKKHLPG